VTSKDYAKLKNILQTEFTDNVVPILIREKMDRYELSRNNSMFEVSDNLGLFGGYNEELIDEAYIAKIVEEIDKNLEQIQGKLNAKDDELKSLRQIINEVSAYPYNQSSERQYIGKIKELEQKAEQINQEVISINQAISKIKDDMGSAKEELLVVEEKLALVTAKINAIRMVLDKKEAYFANRQKFVEKTNLKLSLLEVLSTERETEKELIVKISETDNNLSNKETLIENTRVDEAIYLSYDGIGKMVTNEDGVLFPKNSLKESLRKYQSQSEFVNISSIKQDIADYTKLRTQYEEDLEDLHADKSVYTKIKFSKETLKRLTKSKDEIQEKLRKLDKERYLVDNQISEAKKLINGKKEECQSSYGKPYDNTVQYKNFEQARELEVKNITHCKEEIQDMEYHISNLNDKINDLLSYKDEIISQGAVLIQISIDNYKDVYASYKKNLSDLIDKLKELETSIKGLLQDAKVKYIEKYENEVIARFLRNFDNIDSERLSMTIKKFSDNIEVLKEKESSLEKQFITLAGGIQDYTSRLHQELQKIDKNSRINPKDKKLFELTGIAKEGMKESLDDFLTEIVNDIVDGKKKEDYINSVLTAYNLLDAFISLNKVQAYAMKFNLYDEVKVRFEETYNGGQCSGAQRMIIAFIILKSIMYYASEGLIDNNKESTSFMFLDNPFGVLSTKEMLEIFYKIAKKFNTTLYSWTDVSKPEIIRQHNVIYYFKLVLVGSKEYVVVEDKRDKESLETINMDFIKQTSEQLTLDLQL
jgi:DNA repair exonuclease SbcCD ATPase subunit